MGVYLVVDCKHSVLVQPNENFLFHGLAMQEEVGILIHYILCIYPFHSVNDLYCTFCLLFFQYSTLASFIVFFFFFFFLVLV